VLAKPAFAFLPLLLWAGVLVPAERAGYEGRILVAWDPQDGRTMVLEEPFAFMTMTVSAGRPQRLRGLTPSSLGSPDQNAGHDPGPGSAGRTRPLSDTKRREHTRRTGAENGMAAVASTAFSRDRRRIGCQMPPTCLSGWRFSTTQGQGPRPNLRHHCPERTHAAS
jgi:hypothetical protein